MASPTSEPTSSMRCPMQFPTSSPAPSFGLICFDQEGFCTLFWVSQRNVFNATETRSIELLHEGYTAAFAPKAVETMTLCHIEVQELVDCFASDPFCVDFGVNVSDPNSQEGCTNCIDFSCNCTLTVTNVTGFPKHLARHTDTHGNGMTMDMRTLGPPIPLAFAATIQWQHPAPPPMFTPVEQPSVLPLPTTVLLDPTSSSVLCPCSISTVEPPHIPNAHGPHLLPSVSPLSGNNGGAATIVAVFALVWVWWVCSWECLCFSAW